MSQKDKVEHLNCGTPQCCGTCLNEEVPVNSISGGGVPSLTDPTDAYALQKKRMKAKLMSKMIRRKNASNQ
jgi:hypothetical protein